MIIFCTYNFHENDFGIVSLIWHRARQIASASWWTSYAPCLPTGGGNTRCIRICKRFTSLLLYNFKTRLHENSHRPSTNFPHTVLLCLAGAGGGKYTVHRHQLIRNIPPQKLSVVWLSLSPLHYNYCNILQSITQNVCNKVPSFNKSRQGSRRGWLRKRSGEDWHGRRG